MASPFQQQSLQRKFVYFGLIVALFTGSLILRKVDIHLGFLEFDSLNTRAAQLHLREADQGEVELTSSALRLTLGGMRGLAITSLWLAAIEKQKRHEWTELEVLVRSLTKLQPHYVSPWLFQSWNLAFNVSVECDRSRDKYFYVTRGAQLLAEGERKNEGNKDPNPERRTPGHPEMRYHVGFTCQLKIGHGDEHRTMRCLLDLSCIPPNKRNPDALWAAGAAGREVDLVKFREFCRDHPRLVRRLREQIGADVRQKGFETPREIVDFLAANRDVPSLFQKPDAAGNVKLIEEETERFPVLPPGQEVESGEADVFAVARTWYEYAQEPLPPETGTFGPGREPVEVKGKSRLPRMSQYIFRNYPARAQAYVAEELEKEGWFSPRVAKVAIVVTGERIDFVERPKDLTLPLVGANVAGSLASLLGQGPLLTAATLVPGRTGVAQDPDVVAVTTDRLDAARAWRKAFEAFILYARKNGLLADYPPLREARGRRAAEAARVGPNSAAALDLKLGDAYVAQTNLVSFLARADAENHPRTLVARKKFYEADRKRKEDDNPRALVLYREALDEWIDVMLRFPAFGQQSDVQEDIYELELAYLRLVQREKERQLEPLLVGVAQAGWPAGFVDAVLARSKRPVLPTRNVLGPLDLVYVCVGPPAEADGVRQLALAQLAVWPPVPLQKLVESDRGGQAQRRLLTAVRSRTETPGPNWRPLIDDMTIIAVRQRYNLSLPSGVALPNPGGPMMMPGGPGRPGGRPPPGGPRRSQ